MSARSKRAGLPPRLGLGQSSGFSDGGRKIDVAEEGWEGTLRGEAAELYGRWRTELKPRGFGLSARLPCGRRLYKQQGSFAPRALPRLNATTNPSVTLSPSIDFPVEPVIRSTLLRRFRAGTRRASPVARHVLATVLSLPPRRSEGAASVRFRLPMLPSPYG